MRLQDGKKIPAVLIVEDEPLVRLGAVKIIEDGGFEVIEAASADEAIRILECRSDIRVVFTDIHMPGSMSQTRSCRPQSVAADQDNSDFGSPSDNGEGSSGRGAFFR
jgi:CheY-like chemotaxis protein